MTRISAVSRRARPHQIYRLRDGAKVLGVTTVLSVIAKPQLIAWSNRLGLEGIKSSEHVDDLADAGTLAHQMIQCHLVGGSPDIAEYTPNQVRLAENAVASFHEWTRGKVIQTLESEWQLVSERHRYGGTCDWYGVLNGRQTLLDFKTGSAIYDEHLYQLAAYHNLVVESGHEVEEARVLQVGRSDGGSFSEKVLPAAALEPYWRVFLAALELKRAIDGTKERRRRRW
jgi:hypothetical protein